MNNIKFVNSSWNLISDLKNEYLGRLTNYPDGFWDDLLWEADIYACVNDSGERIGFFAIGNAWDGGNSIRAFYVKKEYLTLSQDLYSQIIKDYQIVSALVSSSDELHVCLAFEKMHELKSSFDMQAYNLVYTDADLTAKYDMSCFYELSEDEYDEMNRLTESMWKDDSKNPDNKFYCIKDNGVILGYGNLFPHKLDKRCACVGDYVLPQYRNQGVGRSIIINLSKIARKKGLIPTSGCWYYNHASYAALKRSGFVPTSRLFYVKFYKNDQ